MNFENRNTLSFAHFHLSVTVQMANIAQRQFFKKYIGQCGMCLLGNTNLRILVSGHVIKVILDIL